MWSLVEVGVYLIAACLPVLRPLYLSIIGVMRKAGTTVVGSKSHGTPLRSLQTDSKADDDQRGLVHIQMDIRQDVSDAGAPINRNRGGVSSLEEGDNHFTFVSAGDTRWENSNSYHDAARRGH